MLFFGDGEKEGQMGRYVLLPPSNVIKIVPERVGQKKVRNGTVDVQGKVLDDDALTLITSVNLYRQVPSVHGATVKTINGSSDVSSDCRVVREAKLDRQVVVKIESHCTRSMVDCCCDGEVNVIRD